MTEQSAEHFARVVLLQNADCDEFTIELTDSCALAQVAEQMRLLGCLAIENEPRLQLTVRRGEEPPPPDLSSSLPSVR